MAERAGSPDREAGPFSVPGRWTIRLAVLGVVVLAVALILAGLTPYSGTSEELICEAGLQLIGE